MNQIIIISFTFPPQYGIGGRRWAKFTKYFAQQEVNLQVYTTTPVITSSNWLKDVPKSVATHFIPSQYPKTVRFGPQNFLDHIKYRADLWFIKQKTKGNYYDPSCLWNRELIPAIEEVLDNVDVLIATAGPFSYLHHLLKLKESFPKLKLVVDLRDPWTNNKTAYGYDSLTPDRFSYEKNIEKEVISGFDLIVCVADVMTNYFKSIVPNSPDEKFITVPNGYDPDEAVTSTGSKRDSRKTQIALVGTLYGKTIEAILTLTEIIKEYEDKVTFIFCGVMNNDAHMALSKRSNVKLIGKVTNNKSKEIISQADVCLLILPDDLTYSFSTKFCEYVHAQKPIWVISKDGSTPNFVRDNGIGFHSLPTYESLKNGIEEILKNLETIDYSEFDDAHFNLKNISNNFFKRLIELTTID